VRGWGGSGVYLGYLKKNSIESARGNMTKDKSFEFHPEIKLMHRDCGNLIPPLIRLDHRGIRSRSNPRLHRDIGWVRSYFRVNSRKESRRREVSSTYSSPYPNTFHH
jgi:hypothetical protein